jgi:hypothetical protein
VNLQSAFNIDFKVNLWIRDSRGAGGRQDRGSVYDDSRFDLGNNLEELHRIGSIAGIVGGSFNAVHRWVATADRDNWFREVGEKCFHDLVAEESAASDDEDGIELWERTRRSRRHG